MIDVEPALRVIGAAHVALGLVHVVLWRALRWGDETARLSPLTARVFAVHTFYVALVVVALGVVAVGAPARLVEKSALSSCVAGFATVFWALRVIAQFAVFDPVLLPGSPRRLPLRVAAFVGFSSFTGVWAWAFAETL